MVYLFNAQDAECVSLDLILGFFLDDGGKDFPGKLIPPGASGLALEPGV